jgi:hypothetical protein
MTAVSRNAKTGPIPVVTVSRDTCPNTCPFKNAGCYAEGGPLRLHWDRVTRDGTTMVELAKSIKRLPKKQLWRYGQAGDIPTCPEELDTLITANAGRPVLAYSHRRDVETIARMTNAGFHINLSCDSLAQVDEIADGVSAVVVVSSEYQRRADETQTQFRKRLGGKLKMTTPAGRPVALCPQTYIDNLTCQSCGLCASPRKNHTVVAFPSHGSRKRLVDRVVEVFNDGERPSIVA